MSNADMITAITNAIQTDANVILVLRAAIIKAMPQMQTAQLQNIMTVLGLPIG